MSMEEFSEDCEGCRPMVIDCTTREQLPPHHPIFKAIMRVWETSTLEERRSYHAVCCQNSRDPEHIEVMNKLMARVGIEAAAAMIASGRNN